MFGINRRFFTILAGIAATCLIGYCVYFDHKRVSALDYRKKIHERRQRNRSKSNASITSQPPTDQEQLLRYFMLELQLSDALMLRGEYEKGCDHLVNAIIASGKPSFMMRMLSEALTPQILDMLVQKMQTNVRMNGMNHAGNNSEGIPTETLYRALTREH